MTKLYLTFGLLCLASLVTAADLGTGKIYEAIRAEPPPVIDGNLDDGVWKQASAAGEFWTLKGTDQVQQTTFQLAYDSQNLYLAVTNLESNLTAMKCDVRIDDMTSIMGDEAVEWFLQPQSGGDYYQFAANCGGARYDARALDSSWNAAWQAATGRRADAWTLECAIAFSSFGSFGVPGATWGLNVCRDRQAGGDTEWSAWSPTPGGFHQPQNFGRLVFGGPSGGLDRAALIECARAAIKSFDLERRLNEAVATIRGGNVTNLSAEQRRAMDEQTARGQAALDALARLLKSDKPLDTRAWMETNARLQQALVDLEEAAWQIKFETLLAD